MKCIVKENRPLVGRFFYMSVVPRSPWGGILPGQFVMVRCSDSLDPFLRRPMSIADFAPDGSRFGMVVQIAGNGTKLLSKHAVGDSVDVSGPFGTSFTIPDKAKKIWLVAGGVGIAPFIGLAGQMKTAHVEYTLFQGARTSEFLLYGKSFKDMGIETVVSTEDGSAGYEGYIIEPLVQRLNGGEKPDLIFTCGPSGMMKAVKDLAIEHNIPLKVSLENLMACGVGACLGCVTKVTGEDRYINTCKKGPVFDASKVEI